MILAFTLTTVSMYGLVLLGAGIAAKVFVGRRQFNRRNINGLQHFSNYWTGIAITFFESVLSVFSAIAVAGGIILLLVELFNQR